MLHMTSEELDDFHDRSDQWHPDANGPMISNGKPTFELGGQYINVDRLYLNKIHALVRDYSHYRSSRGDGNCGWRALAFSYFETLGRIGDPDWVRREHARFFSIRGLLKDAGYPELNFEDFEETTLRLFLDIREKLLENENPLPMLEERFNDEAWGNPIIAYFRFIAGATLKTKAEKFQPFLENRTILEYCRCEVDPFEAQLGQLGIQALLETVFYPGEISVDVIYLDRSPGNEVTTHHFVHPNAVNADIAAVGSTNATFAAAEHKDFPIIQLLYRPGHYDILYKRYEPNSVVPPVVLRMYGPNNLDAA